MDAQTYRRLRGCDGSELVDWVRNGLLEVRILTTYLLVSGNGKLVSVQQTENGNMQWEHARVYEGRKIEKIKGETSDMQET